MELVVNREIEEVRQKTHLEFILVPGAGLRGWVWKDLQNELSYPSTAIEFLNVDRESGIDDYEISALRQIEHSKIDKKILVTHGEGGVLGLRLAASLGEQLVGMVSMASIIPALGGSYLSTLPTLRRVASKLYWRGLGTKPSEGAIQDTECNDLNSSQIEEVIKRYHTESLGYYEDECGALVPHVPRLYLKLLNDLAVRPELQDQMIRNFSPTEVKEIPTGHLAMLREPAHLARLLDFFADEQLLFRQHRRFG